MPTGRLIQMPAWENSKIFPNTTRDWWVYVPAGYKPDGSAALMVFKTVAVATPHGELARAHRIRKPDRPRRNARDGRRHDQSG